MPIIDELKILVSAEVAKAISDLDKVEKQTGKTGASFKDFAKQIAGYTTGMGLAVDATKKVLSTIGQLAKESVVLAAGFETAKTSWGVLLGDMEDGEEMFANIQSLAAKTPLSFESVEQGSRTLKQFGLATENIIPTIKMLGDVSMGNAERLRGLSVVYGQVMSTGRLMGQDLLQLINQGFNPLNEISKTTGESIAELKQRMEKGGISAQEVADAFKSATSEGGLFYNMMDKTAETTAGKWSTAQDNFKQSLAELGEKIIPIVNKALDEYNKTASRMQARTGVKKVLAGESKSYEDITDAIREVNLELAELDESERYSEGLTDELVKQRDTLNAQKTILVSLGKEAFVRATNEEKLRKAEKDKLADLEKRKQAEKKALENADAEIAAMWELEEANAEVAKIQDELNKKWAERDNKNIGLDRALEEDALVNAMFAEIEAEKKILALNDEAIKNNPYKNLILDMKLWNEETEKQTDLQKDLQSIAEGAFKSLGNALGEALVNGEEGWEAFADAGKAAIASVLEAFAAQWAIEAVAAYAAGNIPSGVGYTAASVAGYAGAGAIRAMANGGEFDTTGPTMMMVGEAGREHVSVSPASRGGGGGATVINYNIAGSLVSERQLNQRIRSASTGSNR